MLRSSPKPSFSYIYNCAINAINTYKVVRRAHMVRGIKQKPKLFLSKQCWSPDTKYLYYPHVENVTERGSFLPASITSNI